MRDLDIDITINLRTGQTNDDKEAFASGEAKWIPGHGKYKETKVSKWDFESPYSVTIRIVRFKITGGTYETIAMSLDKKYDHAWNAVLYEGEWYFVDVYWDDEAWTMSKSPKTTYFMYGAKSKQYRQHKQRKTCRNLCHEYSGCIEVFLTSSGFCALSAKTCSCNRIWYNAHKA
jgi:hypothetical protein